MIFSDQNKMKTILFTFFIAFSFLITGCGGGGGGGDANPFNPVPPVIPPPTGVSGSIDGYVSQNPISVSIRADVGETLAEPIGDATVELIAIDANGVEHILGLVKTNLKGYYSFLNVPNPYGLKNLIVKATSNGLVFECVVPAMKPGEKIQAPTMDPNTTVQAKIIREAAKDRKHQEINLGKLLAVLPPQALALLEGKLSLVLKGFFAREELEKQKFGASKTNLDAFAFQTQQEMNEAVEKGNLSAEDAWKKFDLLMDQKARELGLKSEDLALIDDINQKLIFEPFKEDLNRPELEDSFRKMFLEKARNRKLKALELLKDSIKVLIKEDPNFYDFFSSLETFKSSIQSAQSIEDLDAIFLVGVPDQRKFLEYISHAMLVAGFPPEYVGRVFDIPPPDFGISYGGGSTRTVDRSSGSTFSPMTGTTVDPKAQATAFIDWENDLIGQLIEKIGEISKIAGLSLSPETIKAIAYIIWAGSPENLNFPPPPPPTDVPPYSDYIMQGKIELAANPQVYENETYKYVLKNIDYGVVYPISDSNFQMPDILAYLVATTPIELITLKNEGSAVMGTTTLEELVKSDFVEIEGLLAKAPPMIVFPTLPGNDGPIPPTGGTITTGTTTIVAQKGMAGYFRISRQSSGTGSGSSPGSTGSSGSGVVIAEPFNMEPVFIIVKKARILPPPPPPPQELSNEKGVIVQFKTSNGQIVAGVYVFESPNPSLDGAVLKANYYGGPSPMEIMIYPPQSSVQLSNWVGKTVLISGTLFQETDGGKTIMVTDVRTP